MGDNYSIKVINRWRSVVNSKKAGSMINGKLEMIDKKVGHRAADDMHDQVFQDFDCLSCANCCKSIPPILSGRDIKRISSALGISRDEFYSSYVKVDEDGDTVINSSPCPFLMDDNKCRIYEYRPAACRDYPHSGDSQFKKNISLHKRNVKYCPALFEIVERLHKVALD